jgi:hypothetical protein
MLRPRNQRKSSEGDNRDGEGIGKVSDGSSRGGDGEAVMIKVGIMAAVAETIAA